MYVTEIQTIAKYTTAGALVNASLVSGLDVPIDMAISGNDLFVADLANGRIGEYATDGTVINASLISGLNRPWGLAISGNNLFVANNGDGTVGEYTTAGVPVNPVLISGLRADYLDGVAVSGNSLYVVNEYDGTIGECAVDGSVVNASLINTLTSEGQNPFAIAIVPEPSPSVLLAVGALLLLGLRRIPSSAASCHFCRSPRSSGH